MSVFIIAEAGVNHNGSIQIAKRLIDVAVDAGANAVKFQTFTAEKLVSKKAQKANYQKQTTNTSESQFDMVKKLELDIGSHKELIDYCKRLGIVFISTPFDMDSIKMLNSLGMNIFKIPSGEITNLPYLRYIGSLRRQIILSTGMANLQEVKHALDILNSAGTPKKDIVVLHANTMYPTPMKDVNLNAMLTIQQECGVAVGYSDHTLGTEVGVAATSMGATIIEKHFTLDKEMEGPDHIASLEPKELKSMISSIRNIEKAMGNGDKVPSVSERANIKIVRKSIVANQDIKKGDILTEKNITTKRPGFGISPIKWDSVIGSTASKDYKLDDMI